MKLIGQLDTPRGLAAGHRSRKQRLDDVFKVIRSAGQHSGECVIFIIRVRGCVQRTKSFAHGSPDIPPHVCSAEARQFGGEDRIYAQRHRDKKRARLNGTRAVHSAGTASDIVGEKSQGLSPSRLIHI